MKSQLASAYVQEILSERSGEASARVDLNDTLKELFGTFFPDKSYLGVRPSAGGRVSFPVRTSDGGEHDINELSSGEKEVLYGYLRLRNSTPRNSVILIDEPELHLNPALLQGFPDFYYRNVGQARGNQLWLVTHSDTLLRQAVGSANYSVFHASTASSLGAGENNQASEIVADADIDLAVMSLVGDLATYRPHAKVVVFEGGGRSEFDVNFVRRIFPEFARRVNCVSGGDKARVRALYDTLASTAASAGLADKFYAITDADSTVSSPPTDEEVSSPHFLKWDVYHIENYLLDARFIDEAIHTVRGRRMTSTPGQVDQDLASCAEESVDDLVLLRLRNEVNGRIVNAVGLGGSPGSRDPAKALRSSLASTWTRLESVRSQLTDSELKRLADSHKATLVRDLDDGSWRRSFPARMVLKRFVSRHLDGAIKYDAFVSLVVDQMADAEFQPEGMRRVLEGILADSE